MLIIFYYSQITFTAIGIILAGILMLVTPWVFDLALLVVITTISGLMFGYFDAGKYYIIPITFCVDVMLW